MAGEWTLKTLGEVYDFGSGLSKPREEFGFGYPFLSFKDVFDNYFVPKALTQLVNSSMVERQACSIKRGDLFLTRTSETSDELGMSAVALEDVPEATFNGFTKRLRPKENSIVPEFAGYYFRSPSFRSQMYALSNLSTRASLNNEMLGRLSISLPPIAEQTLIGATLKSIDDKIELNRHMAVTLEEMAHTLFRSWFVDFDPVRAKAESRPTGLPAITAAVFPGSFGENGLPAGWNEAPLGDVFEVRSGNTPRTEEARYWGGEHHWATPKDLSLLSSPVLLKTDRMLSDQGIAAANSGLLPAGSVLLSTRAPIGYLAFATRPVAINQGMAGIVGKEVSTAYAWLWCATNIDTFLAVSGGSTFPEISKGTLRRLPMIVPTAEVLSAFAACVDPIIERLIALSDECDRLAALRDTLLPRLISGELRIKDVAAKGEAA